MQTRTITVDYARPRGYDVGYRAENNFTELSLPVPAELENADSYRVYFESTVGDYLQTETLTPVDGYVTVKITSDVVPEPGNMAAQLVAFADGEIVGYAPMITGSAKVSIPDGTERLSHSLAAEIALNTAARHSHSNKAILDKFAETDGKPTYDGEALGGGGGTGDFIIKMTVEGNGSELIVTSCDTTVEQIDEAVAAEKRVVLIASIDSTILELPMIQGDQGYSYYFGAFLSESVLFSSVYKIENTSSWAFSMTQIWSSAVSYSNDALPNVKNVKAALDELVPKSHSHDNKSVLDKLSDSNGKLQYNGSDVGLSGGFSVPIVDSVDEMVDTSKQYILKSTGTIWEWKETTTEKEVTVRNDITSGYERGRLSSGGANSGDVQTHTLTPLIDITKAEYQGKTIQIHLEGNRYFSEAPETYIMTALFDPNKNTIIGRAYSTLDRNAGLLGALDNAGATVEIHSTNSATLTIPVPLTEDTGKSVGYLRFCGLGTVDGTVYITYTETQTVTEETWTDTGVAFGGGGSIDTETLAKIAELNNEGTDPTTVKLLAQPVLNFYNASAYSDNDYTYSHLSNITYPCRADIPVPFTVKWNHNEDAMRTTVAVDTKAIGTLNAYTMITYDATGLDNFPIYNLLPNKTYYYKVTHVLADGSLVEAKSGNFTTSNETVRMLYIDGTQNVRDLGGWTGLNGKKIKYGKIIRGASLGDSSYHGLMLTGKGRLALAELKIQAELNLGAVDSETSIAPNVAYKKVYYTNYAIAITDETYRTMFKTLLEYIVSCLDGTLAVSGLSTVARNIYMHCQGGCDRTGTLSFLLLGLLGVSESDLAKEYEISSFSDVGFGRLRTTKKAVDTYDYVGMVEALKTYSGDTITDKFVSFAITGCGISIDTITSFRNLMLE